MRHFPAGKSPSMSLKALIAESGLKQKFVAQRMGVAEGTVTRWIGDSSRIPQHVRPRLAAVLGVPPEAIGACCLAAARAAAAAEA